MFIESFIIKHEFSISSSVIINGGAILNELSLKRNQSTIIPLSIHFCITFCKYSFCFNSTASRRPLPRISLIAPFLRSFLNNCDLLLTCSFYYNHFQ